MLLPLTGSRNGAQGDFDGGHKIKSVKIVSSKGKSTEVDAKFIITDTRMQVFLPQGLKAKGAVKSKLISLIFLERRFRQNWSFGY
jgi:hypothetical protein